MKFFHKELFYNFYSANFVSCKKSLLKQMMFIYTNLRFDILYQRHCYNGEPYNEYAIIGGISFNQSSALHNAHVVRYIKTPTPKPILEIFLAIISHKLSMYSTVRFPKQCGPADRWQGRQTLLLLFCATSWASMQLTYSSCQWQNRQKHLRNPHSENETPNFVY